MTESPSADKPEAAPQSPGHLFCFGMGYSAGALADSLLAELKDHKGVKALVRQLEDDVTEGRLPPTIAAHRLIETFKNSN